MSSSVGDAPFDTVGDVPFDTVRPSGRRLPGVLTRPAGSGLASDEVVLLLHGLFSHHDHNFAPALAARLAADLRLSVYRFSFRFGADDSEPDYQLTFPGFVCDLDDVRAAVATLAAVGLRVVAVVGHSKGANVALMAASACVPDARCVVALAPRFHMPGMLTALFAAELPLLDAADSFEWTPRGGGGAIVVTRRTCAEVRALDMGAVLDALPAATALLVAHGTADRVIPHADADAVRARRPSATVLKLKTGHTFADKRVALLDAVVAFVGAHCAGRPLAVAAACAPGGVLPAAPQMRAPKPERRPCAAVRGAPSAPRTAESAPGAPRTEAAVAVRYAALAMSWNPVVCP